MPATEQPIAIVGMACRFPGAPDLSSYWRLLEGGKNAVTQIEPGTGKGRTGQLFPAAEVQNSACLFGAYLDEIDLFDAAFFRISPVEAQLLDPQQRLMLETSWRALEDAGLDPDGLKGSRTGVYAGISNYDYRSQIMAAGETSEPASSLYMVSGTSFNTAIGRVAFALDLAGPAMALDTACSSSLVAIHQAVSGLQRGEADLALAGGVHAILSGRLSELRGNAGMLAPDGQCKTFDAAANGYVRGEGCGIVVLKRLPEAEADGDRIWGVIRGSAINQDGASPGLTVPSGPAQQRVIEAALQRAGVPPAQVDYVEAHGTGTVVGDPIEAQALASAYGKGRAAEQPLLIGSVKTNIGHLEPAAGVAGLIKVILAMQHGVIPKHLHFRTPNPQLDWERLPLQVTASATDWPRRPDRPARAGVSGFGWSGTNAHVIVEAYTPVNDVSTGASGKQWAAGPPQPIAVSLPAAAAEPPPAPKSPAARRVRFLPLSGKSGTALRDLAGRYLSWLDEHIEAVSSTESAGSLLADLAWTAGVGRGHFSHRAGLLFTDAGSLREGLELLSQAAARPVPRTAKKLAFAYTGQASQWVGMGEALYESEPVARAVLDRCDEALRELRGASLLDVMFGRNGLENELDDSAWKPPAIYALECALTALWASMGIRPDVVVGHSLGEIAAAQAAGVFGLEDGLRFAAARGELTAALPQEGSMGIVFAPRANVAEMVDSHNAASADAILSIAADNGAHQALSGLQTDVETVLDRFEAEGVRVVRLRASQAYHSALVEPAMDGLEAVCAEMAFALPAVPMVSSMTGQLLEPGKTLDGTYWRQQMREPVAFRGAVETLAELGIDMVVELGPHSVLGPMVTLAWPDRAPDARTAGNSAPPPIVLSSLLRPSSRISQAEADQAFTAAVAGVYEAGLPLSFTGIFAGEVRRRIALPGYPFQRERYWVDPPRRKRTKTGHPLLGERHESASGEIAFDTELFPSDPEWLGDHRVFERLLAPGALYGAMAATASQAEGSGTMLVEDMQFHQPLIFPEPDAGDAEQGRKVQILLDRAGTEATRKVRILSKGADGEEWTLHAEGGIPREHGDRQGAEQADLESLKTALSPVDLPAYYRTKAEVGIDLGPSFRTLENVWSRPGEALGEVTLSGTPARAGSDLHPLLLDGCLQVVAAARHQSGADDGATYLPFGWEHLWLAHGLPERLFCHVLMREEPPGRPADSSSGEATEVFAADLHLYDPNGAPIGRLSGYTVKRATRAALLAAMEGVDELLYKVVWREQALPPGMLPADFLPGPSALVSRSKPFSEYLVLEGADAGAEADFQTDLERLAWSYALSTLEQLGWERAAGAVVVPEDLRRRLNVSEEHARLFRRILEILARSGVVEAAGPDFVVAVGPDDPLPADMPHDAGEFETVLQERYAHGLSEIALFQRCAGALADVLRGGADPLSLLFGEEKPTAADLYRDAPAWRAANRMLGEVVQTQVAELPGGRALRVLEVGAGIGSATECILPALPAGRFSYTYTDISAGFFAEAEGRFADYDEAMEYRVLDIERDPLAQGFDAHGYDLLIAANVLHATRYLNETLDHCRVLLAPAGQLVALENQRGRGWMDLIFGQLDGWWRFADAYRPHHALAGSDVWRQALADAGFEEVEVLGVDESEAAGLPDRGVIAARGPAQVLLPRGVWVVAADRSGLAEELAAQLAEQNQTVILTDGEASENGPAAATGPGVFRMAVEMEQRESWQSLLGRLPQDAPLAGIVHLAALDGRGAQATTGEMAAQVSHATISALTLTQALIDADLTPANGTWFVTRGAQVLEQERSGELAGATLWGFGKVVAREAVQLQARMIDLAPDTAILPDGFTDELLYPDAETHIAYRRESRCTARLARAGTDADRLALPEGSDWVLAPDPGGAIEKLQVLPLAQRSLQANEVRVAVEACGLNFLDVFRAMGLVEEGLLGEEMSGQVTEVGAGVSTVSVGDRVVGLAFGTFGTEVVTREELVALAPPDLSVSALATLPSVFTTCVLSFDLAELKTGERVLIHAGAGGVGLAAIQLAQAAGAEVFATASAPKQAYLRSLGVTHVFDSRQTAFGQEILEATGGEGVDVVLNSLTGPGFIDASLSCLAQGGRFVELGRRDILSEEEMAAARPDVSYSILDLYTLKENDPARPGAALRGVVERLTTGETTALAHSRWPLAEAGAAMEFMRAARHIGKIILTVSPLQRGRLRQDRTYLVTGGLGGIGCLMAEWLADRGAGAIVLNGRRKPDPAAQETIDKLAGRGATVQVELADVTDAGALDDMLARMDKELPPLGGVIHSVGLLSDAALGNQSRETFEQVLGPKILGAWHLHRATENRDLDMFVLFSSVAGVLGNPGQANHAAANAFLDQLAAHRRALGLPGQAIAWGAWSELGEAEEQRERISRQIEATGIDWITPQQGLKAFERLVHEDPATAVVLARDWTVFETPDQSSPPFLEDLLAVRDDSGADTSPLSDNLLSRLQETPAAGREELLASFLQQEVQAVLRLPDAPEPAVGFFDLGMDSLMAVELRNRLNRAFSGEYTAPNTVVFDYPDITTLASHLAGELAEAGGEPAEPATQAQPEPQPQPVDRSEDNGIAIIGMACRFPGAPDLEAFWQLLDNGLDAVTDRRREAESLDDVFGSPAGSDAPPQHGGFIEGIGLFDSRFFHIAPVSARIMDPQQRLLLETSWLALEDAGIDPETLRGSRTGVYAGIATSEYRDLMADKDYGVNYLGTASSMAVGRVSYQFGLEGPSSPVTLNCAASLVALHQAVTGLQKDEIDAALVGGVNVVLSHKLASEMEGLGILSRQGACRAFDAAADGAVRGEGCGMLVLKRLAEAEVDGDRIWGVIRGSAVNQSGASAGPTAAKGPAQEQVIEAALARAGIAPNEVDYLEAHGAGSALGDPIEIQAAAAVYGRARPQDRPLLIGSVKTNIGHLEPAAGAASLIKTVLAMNRSRIPKQLHFENPTPHLDWEGLPVRIASEHLSWPDHPGRPARAGVSAFGISGTNAHVVVEAYGETGSSDADAGFPPAGAARTVGVSAAPLDPDLPASASPLAQQTQLLPLSGRTGEALRDLALRYLSWLDKRTGGASPDGSVNNGLLADMAWTASVGRAHFAYRKGIVFNDATSLREGLEALAQTDTASLTPVEPSGAGRPAANGPEAQDGGASVETVAQAYEAGRPVAFADLFAGEKRRRISLPGYPFQRRRYWIE